MRNIKQINIKNVYYFSDDMINIENSHKNIDIYHIQYITIKDIDH